MDRTPYDGGNGASLKAKRGGLSSTRSSTPYQRPSSGRHASAGRQQAALAKSGTRSWGASGIVDSASRILTKGAAYLFTSLFKRQAPAIAATEHWGPRPEADDAAAEDIPPLELVPDENPADMPHQVEEPSGSGRRDPPVQDGDGQLEDILKQSNLTREQCERYITLLKSKVGARDPSVDGRDNSRLVIYGESSMDPLAAVSQFDTHVHYSQPDLDPYEPARAPWERNERPSEPQIKRPARPSSSGWTPLQTPITGGRELLKSRVSLIDESGPARRMKNNSLRSEGTGLRKLQGEVDLSCFRKETKTSLGSAIWTPIPKQSARTARKIMETLDRKSLRGRPLVRQTSAEAKGTRFSKASSTSPLTSLTDTRDRVMPQHGSNSKRKATEENVKKGEASSWHENTVKSVRFSFPSTAPGPELPTPKAIPVSSSTPISGNGGLVTMGSPEASPSLSNLASSSTPNGESVAAGGDEDMLNLFTRAEKVTSLLNSYTTSPTLTKAVSEASQDHKKPTANGFYTFAAAGGFTGGGGHVTHEDPYPSDHDHDTAAANLFSIRSAAPTSFFVDAQSLAPPETSNSPFAAAPTLTMTKSLDKSKRKLSRTTKRLK